MAGSDLCCDSFILSSKNSETEPCDCSNPIVIGVANDLDQLGSAMTALGRDDAELRHMATDRVRSIVRCRTRSCRLLCNIKPDCCCSDFVGTKRIDGRVTASQIAAASLASFLLRLR